MSTTPLPPLQCRHEVLSAARTGNHDAFAALVLPYIPRLQRLARRFTRNLEDAEDVCQESLLKAFRKLDCFTGTQDASGADFRSWLMKITANSAIDFMRRKQSCKTVSLEDFEPIQSGSYRSEFRGSSQNPEASYARKERLRMLAEMIADLPGELRSVWLLRIVVGHSTEEVAMRLGISTMAVRLRLFRAHGRLRNNLGLAANHGGPSGRVPVLPLRTRRDSLRRNKATALLPYHSKEECAYGE